MSSDTQKPRQESKKLEEETLSLSSMCKLFGMINMFSGGDL